MLLFALPIVTPVVSPEAVPNREGSIKPVLVNRALLPLRLIAVPSSGAFMTASLSTLTVRLFTPVVRPTVVRVQLIVAPGAGVSHTAYAEDAANNPQAIAMAPAMPCQRKLRWLAQITFDCLLPLAAPPPARAVSGTATQHPKVAFQMDR
nr:hypothetical protein [Comamonas sp. CMM02]